MLAHKFEIQAAPATQETASMHSGEGTHLFTSASEPFARCRLILEKVLKCSPLLERLPLPVMRVTVKLLKCSPLLQPPQARVIRIKVRALKCSPQRLLQSMRAMQFRAIMCSFSLPHQLPAKTQI